MADKQFVTVNKEEQKRISAATVTGATLIGAGALLASSPASATTTPAQDITAAVDSLGGIAGAALVVVIGVMVSAMGVGYAKRVGSKG